MPVAYMSFRLEMDRPIIKGSHYIVPGGFNLRFFGGGVLKEDIQFDFLNYEGNIVDGNSLDCHVSGLDVNAYEGSEKLGMCLSKYQYKWAEFFVYTGEDKNSVINPVRATNIIFNDGERSYKLRDYVFPEVRTALSSSQFSIILGIMNKAIRFCISRQMMVKDGAVRFFEKDGKIYLTSKVGNGYCYDVNTGVSSTIGYFYTQNSTQAATSLMLSVVEGLTDSVPFPVKSIYIPFGPLKGGYCKPSVEENGAYDIILE